MHELFIHKNIRNASVHVALVTQNYNLRLYNKYFIEEYQCYYITKNLI